MGIWHIDDPGSISAIAMRDVEGRGEYPNELHHSNKDVARIEHVAPGIVEIESHYGGNTCFVLTGGIHGDEKAGVVILDRLIHGILGGDIPVKRNLLLMYGNLAAMKANGGKGLRCIEPEVGATSNLNRCFKRGKFKSPQCYSEMRANQMMTHAESVLRGCEVEAIDVHQSFAVPTLDNVRLNGDRTEYTYAMLYPHDVEATLLWIYHYFSDIVAGGVLNDMTAVHNTWAGYMAAEFGAHAATFEQGTIGHTDHVTFTPQLFDNFRRSIAGEGRLQNPEGFDVWRCVRGIFRKSDDFAFLDSEGNPLERAPLDFTPLGHPAIARDAGTIHEVLPGKDGERLIFANPEVPIGDRAAQVIARLETETVPRP